MIGAHPLHPLVRLPLGWPRLRRPRGTSRASAYLLRQRHRRQVGVIGALARLVPGSTGSHPTCRNPPPSQPPPSQPPPNQPPPSHPPHPLRCRAGTTTGQTMVGIRSRSNRRQTSSQRRLHVHPRQHRLHRWQPRRLQWWPPRRLLLHLSRPRSSPYHRSRLHPHARRRHPWSRRPRSSPHHRQRPDRHKRQHHLRSIAHRLAHLRSIAQPSPRARRAARRRRMPRHAPHPARPPLHSALYLPRAHGR